jgi:hypothetical protein
VVAAVALLANVVGGTALLKSNTKKKRVYGNLKNIKNKPKVYGTTVALVDELNDYRKYDYCDME